MKEAWWRREGVAMLRGAWHLMTRGIQTGGDVLFPK